METENKGNYSRERSQLDENMSGRLKELVLLSFYETAQKEERDVRVEFYIVQRLNRSEFAEICTEI